MLQDWEPVKPNPKAAEESPKMLGLVEYSEDLTATSLYLWLGAHFFPVFLQIPRIRVRKPHFKF